MKHEFKRQFVGESTCVRCGINVFDSYKDLQVHMFSKVLRNVPDPKTGWIDHITVEEYRAAIQTKYNKQCVGFYIQSGNEIHVVDEITGKQIGNVDCISDEEYLIKKIIK